MGNFSRPEGMNDTIGKMMHTGMMGRGFTVDVSHEISLSECLVHCICGSGVLPSVFCS